MALQEFWNSLISTTEQRKCILKAHSNSLDEESSQKKFEQKNKLDCENRQNTEI